MSDRSKLKPENYDYDRVTSRVEKRLLAYMELAGSAFAGSPSREAVTARAIYSCWRSIAVEAGQLDLDDDVKIQEICASGFNGAETARRGHG